MHQDKVAVITGGGRGFGKAFGTALAARGAHVVLADIDGAADEAGVAAVIGEVAEQYGGVDILVNNAGLHSAGYNKPSAELGIASLRRLFDVNVMGIYICSLAARPVMSGRAGAAVVNISSAAAYASRTAYGVSKLAVRGVTTQLAREFAADPAARRRGTGHRRRAAVPGLSRCLVRDRGDAARHRRLRALGLTRNAHRKEPARA
jgi:NAD(P)-dependent dehydrogenase (short-subunit alcohol dehydrogenase family)